jgi:hypothetical protein
MATWRLRDDFGSRVRSWSTSSLIHRRHSTFFSIEVDARGLRTYVCMGLEWWNFCRSGETVNQQQQQ